MTYIGIERRDPRTGTFHDDGDLDRPTLADETDDPRRPYVGRTSAASKHGSCPECGVLNNGRTWHASTCSVAPEHLRWKGGDA